MADRDDKGRFVKDAKPAEPEPETDTPAAEVAPAHTPPPVFQDPPPTLRVQRMGKNFRIVYETTRNLARFNGGQAVDAGGFADELECRIHLAKVTGGPGADSEEEVVG